MRLFLLLMLIPLASFAQKKTYSLQELIPIDSTTGDVVYGGVVAVEGVSAADLYSRAKTFYLKTFNNSKAVIEADEKDKRIGGKGMYTFPSTRKPSLFSAPTNFMTTIDVQVKDGRYKYEFSQFNIVVTYPYAREVPAMQAFKMYGKKITEKGAESIILFDEGMRSKIDLLNQYMTGKIGGSKDW